jgi:hypothetical protein
MRRHALACTGGDASARSIARSFSTAVFVSMR